MKTLKMYFLKISKLRACAREILKQRYGCLPYLIKEAHMNDKYQYEIKNL